MANFLVIVDPDHARRHAFIRQVEPRLAPVDGLAVSRLDLGDFSAVWAASPRAPVSQHVAADSAAVVWGSEDIVSLAKVVTKVLDDKQFEQVKPKGGVMGGARLGADDIKKVSKWPSRAEQLSILVGQILSPGATLSAQLLGPGAKLASQIKKKSEGEDTGGEG